MDPISGAEHGSQGRFIVQSRGVSPRTGPTRPGSLYFRRSIQQKTFSCRVPSDFMRETDTYPAMGEENSLVILFTTARLHRM